MVKTSLRRLKDGGDVLVIGMLFNQLLQAQHLFLF